MQYEVSRQIKIKNMPNGIWHVFYNSDSVESQVYEWEVNQKLTMKIPILGME